MVRPKRYSGQSSFINAAFVGVPFEGQDKNTLRTSLPGHVSSINEGPSSFGESFADTCTHTVPIFSQVGKNWLETRAFCRNTSIF